MTLGELCKELVATFRANKFTSQTASIECYSIIAHVLQKNKTYLITYPEMPINEDQYVAIHQLVTERLTGMPLAYIVGQKEFWSLPLKVTKDTLIPRPDTETVVEQALLRLHDFSDVAQDKIHILDLGTGTGAIALALKKELPQAVIDAVDESKPALEVAKFNAHNLNLPINCIESSWYNALKEQHQYHVIVANPPYIARNDSHLVDGEIRFEPESALVASMNGMYDLLCIISGAHSYLVNGGWVVVEHGFNQGEATRDLMNKAGFVDITTVRDYGNNERVTAGRLFYKTSN